MAKKRITKSDIAQKGLFDNVTEGAKQAKAEIELLTEAVRILKQNASKIKNDMPKNPGGSTKGMKDFDEATRRANETAKAKLGIDKKLLLEKQKLKQLTNEQNKQIKTTIQATTRLTKEQKKGLGTLQKLEIHNTKLRATRAKLNLETTRGTRILKQINSQLDKNNAKIRSSGDAMKKQRLNVGNYGSAVGKLKGAMAQLGLAFGVFQLIKNSFNIVKDFEQSQANLASVLGVNVDEMESLTAQSKHLGETTKFTASEVASLQLEYAKLGFSQEQIEGMTEATLQLAGATGSTLDESAKVVGGTMRAFGLGAEQTQRVVDAMAKSFSKSSLDMAKFSTAMATVSPTAKAMGFNIEQTTALIGTLTDNNIDASTAGTGLRNMFLDAKKNGLTLDQALEKINGSSDKVATSFDLFGKRGVTLGLVLAQNTEATAKLESELFQAGGSAEEMADKQLDTLNGALALLGSAWEGVVLKFEEGVGVFGLLKDVVLFIAKNLSTLIKVFVTLGTVFGVYKLINLTTKSFKALTLAMNANPFVLIASVIAGAVVALKMFSNELSRTEKVQKTLNDVQSEANKLTADSKAELSALLVVAQDRNLSDDQRVEAIEKLNELSPEYLGNLTLENVATETGVKMINGYIEALDRKALAMAISMKRQALYIKMIDAENSGISDNISWYNELWISMKNIGDHDQAITDTVMAGRGGREELIADIQAQIDALDALAKKKIEEGEISASDLLAGGDPGGGGGDPGDDKPKKLRDLSRKIKDEQIKQIEDDEKRETEARDEKFKRSEIDTKKIVASTVQKNELLKELEESYQNDLLKIKEKFRLKKQAIENKAIQDSQKTIIAEKEMQIEGAESGSVEELNLLSDLDSLKIDQEFQNAQILLQNEKLSQEEKALIVTESQAKIDKIIKSGLQRQHDFMLDALAKQNKEYTRAEKEKLLILLESGKTQEQIDAEMTDFQIEQLEKRIAFMKEKYPEMTDEIRDLEIELAQKIRSKNAKELKTIEDDNKEKIRLAQEATDFITAIYVKGADERIAKIDEEIDAHKKQVDNLKAQANAGNIEAKESIAEENRLIAEGEREKAEIEKRKQQVLMVSAFIKTYLSAIDSGESPGTAFTQALTNQAFLDQVVGNIGSFFEGTEDLGTTSNPLDSNGGRIILAHDNERIMTSKQNKKIGNYSNEEVAKTMESKRLGRLMDGSQTAIGYENILLMNELSKVGSKLDQVNKTIKDKPEQDIRLGEITQKTFEIIESKRKGGLKTISTFKVKAQ